MAEQHQKMASQSSTTGSDRSDPASKGASQDQPASENNQGGIVYVLTNPEMPGLVKIGRTAGKTVDERLKGLYATGVPVPFNCEYAARVSDEKGVEEAFHTAFEPYRINPNREFFRIDAKQAKAILIWIADEDVTPSVQEEADNVETDDNARATIAKRSRRPNMDFEQMGIPIGAELKFINSDKIVEVADKRRIRYEGEVSSLTAITNKLLDKDESDNSVRPAPYWTYDGKSLEEMYEDTYGPRDP